jgi:hypothetical protein
MLKSLDLLRVITLKKGNNKVTLIKVVMKGEWQFFFPKVIKS